MSLFDQVFFGCKLPLMLLLYESRYLHVAPAVQFATRDVFREVLEL